MARYDCYNLNPPEPIVYEEMEDPFLQINECAIDEILYEKQPEKYCPFLDIEEYRIQELIKNGESDQTIPRQLSWHSVP